MSPRRETRPHCYEVSALFPDLVTGTTLRVRAGSERAAIAEARRRLARRRGPSPIAVWVEPWSLPRLR